MVTYSVECEWTRGDGIWRRAGTIRMTLEQAQRKAAEKRARPERYRKVRIMACDHATSSNHWKEVG